MPENTSGGLDAASWNHGTNGHVPVLGDFGVDAGVGFGVVRTEWVGVGEFSVHIKS